MLGAAGLFAATSLAASMPSVGPANQVLNNANSKMSAALDG